MNFENNSAINDMLCLIEIFNKICWTNCSMYQQEMHKHGAYDEPEHRSTLDSQGHSDSDSDPFDEFPDENGVTC